MSGFDNPQPIVEETATPMEFLPPTQREHELYEASLAILTDTLPERADAIFLHGRAAGDTDGLFELASQLVKTERADRIVITGTEGDALDPVAPRAWAGKTAWTEALVALGVPVDKIVYSEPAYHTRQESDVYVDMARQEGWGNAIVLSQPHQALRAILGTLMSVRNAGDYPLRVYSGFPPNTDWDKIVYGSQGQNPMPRRDHCALEMQRVIAYQEKGDLVSLKDYLEYKKMRDTASVTA